MYNRDKTLAIIGNEYVVSLTTGNSAIEADTKMWDWVDEDVLNKEVGICGYNGTEDTIVIPEYVKYNNEIYTVTALKNCSNNHTAWKLASEPTPTDHRFRENDTVKNITILDNITKIDKNLFYGNTTIESVSIPDSVKELGGYMFFGCTNLKKCRLSNSITTIPSFIFRDCNLLEEVNIPESVIEIQNYAFSNVKSIEELIIPKSVKKIGEKAFAGMGDGENAKLKRIVLQEGLEEVGICAFEKASTVEEDLHLPSTLKSDKIGKTAFADFGKNNSKCVYLFDGTKLSTSYE